MTGFDGLQGVNAVPIVPRGVARHGGVVEGDAPATARGTADFAATLHRALRGLSDLQRDAHDKSMALVRGEPVQMHEVLVAMGKSEVAFNLAIEVRNRLLQAWETLSRSIV